jgi:K+-transporting ATPase ATPase B chain
MQRASSKLFEPTQLRAALRDSFAMLAPQRMARNPVMFTCEIGAVLTTIAIVLTPGDRLYASVVSVVLWLTVLFANFAEALAEARGRAQTKSLRAARATTTARRVVDGRVDGTEIEEVDGERLRPGDLVRVTAGQTIPADGEIERGVASIDESAITGESAPVVREAGGDRSSVTGGTRVLSDEIDVRVTAEPGGSFLDRMIALVEGAKRQKTPNELALTILLSGLTLAFLLVTVSLEPMARYFDAHLDIPTLVALSSV